MTSTLERFHGSEIYIRRGANSATVILREVVLHLAATICRRVRRELREPAFVHPEARWMILQEKVPLGRILKDHAIRTLFVCPLFPREPDALICRAENARTRHPLRAAAVIAIPAAALSQVIESTVPPR